MLKIKVEIRSSPYYVSGFMWWERSHEVLRKFLGSPFIDLVESHFCIISIFGIFQGLYIGLFLDEIGKQG